MEKHQSRQINNIDGEIFEEMRYREVITELFEPTTGFELEWDDSFAPTEYHALAYDRQGKIISVDFVPISRELDAIDIEFTRGGSHDITGTGDAERVFATVINAIKTYLEKFHRPDWVIFSGKEDSRFRLYHRLVTRFAGKFGYQQIPYEQLPIELQLTPGIPKNVFVLARSR